MSARNQFVDEQHATETVTGIDTDGSGDVEVTVSDLRQIESPNDVTSQAAGGYVANVQSVDGNVVTFRIFESAGSNAEMAAVTGSSGVTDLWVSAVGT